VVECTGLENRRTSGFPGFESQPDRSISLWHFFVGERMPFLIRSMIFTAIIVCLEAGAFGAEPVTITVDTQKPVHAISPRMVGIFLEDINFGGDGGLNSELIKNGGFEFPQSLMGWKKLGGDGSVRVEHDAPRRATNINYLSLRGRKAGIASEGFRRIGVHKGKEYLFNCWARTLPNKTAKLKVKLVSGYAVLAETDLTISGSEWQDLSATLKPSATKAHCRFELVLEDGDALALDMVSLCPADTWKGRPHGFRKDLVELLADLKPAFFRFPGGCIVEGRDLNNRYQWKTTIGDLADRRLIINRWNTEFSHRPTPDYFQSFAVGFYEYFLMSEEIGAEPLPILNCGMACQFNTSELVPLGELQPYIQDALDLIEFANGPLTSQWGAKRAAMGHPEPFNMKLLGVGNEQWGPQFIERYKAFAVVLKEMHPEIELVSGAGPAPNDQQYHYAWPELRQLNADIVDEHCYAMPDWFLKASKRYDGFERNGPEVCMGEYAAQSVDICAPNNRNNLRCALAEAAFLTGMERNSDIVTMSAYAPLLGHEDAWQWRPNLIWFDNLTAYATPNYYVQQLFSHHRGDEVLPVEVSDSRPADGPHGRIGLATSRSTAEFKEIVVKQGDETVFTGEALDNLDNATSFRGRWTLENGMIRQTGGDGRLLIGDPAWKNYTLSLKARKLGGGEGFVVIFRNSEGGSFLEWNIGGWGNKEHVIQGHLASHNSDSNIIVHTPGSIEQDQWYDVRIELDGENVKCYLDDKLVHDVEIPAPDLARVYAAASLDQKTGDTIVKVVNVSKEPAEAKLNLNGLTGTLQATAITLTGSPDDVNSITEPNKLQPVTKELSEWNAQQTHIFPAHSFTVLRLQPEL
jgi:alpha-N-arabinofuranosidase